MIRVSQPVEPFFTKVRYLSLSWPSPIQSTPLPYLPKIHLNIILPSTLWPSKWSLFFRSTYRNSVCAFPLPIRATCPAHIIHLDFITLIIFGPKYRSWTSSLCNLLQSRSSPPLPHSSNTQISFSEHFSNTMSPCSFLNMKDQVSYSY